MEESVFKELARSAWSDVPGKFKSKIQNVALLVEDEPDEEVRMREGLSEGETLLGLYQGIPHSVRGSEYGVGPTMPDTITLYRLPILEEAREMTDTDTSEFRNSVKKIIRDTIWHEVGHYFGFDEDHVALREKEGTNRFDH